MLWFLLALPLLVAAYLYVLRRKKKAALRYAGLSLVREALDPGSQWRRHVPPILFLLALAAVLLAVARPTANVTLPSQYQMLILAMDVSGRMRAVDVQPNRLAAAQAAARSFVNELPRNTRIGIVTFAGTAALVQPPTQSREDVFAAIDRFELQRATAVGSGLLVALKAIFPDIELDLRSNNPRPDTRRDSPLDPRAPDKPEHKPVPPGSYASAAIVLLSDGQTTTGPDPIEAAKIAADYGVRVYTVGFGTPNGEILVGDGWSVRVRLDEEALKNIASITRGEYFYAGTAHDLKTVYETLNSRLVFEKKETEVTALFSAAAAALAALSALLSLLWFNRIL
jgi:Ca-activated chloride channel family protein